MNLKGNGNIYICAYYRRNVTDEESIRNFETSVTRASAINNAILIIGGDMNFPGWNWKENTLKPNSTAPNLHTDFMDAYLLTLPLFAGVSRVRALSPAWTGSHARETLIPRTHLFPPARYPPNKKIKYNKILTYILRSIFLEIPHLELPR